MNIRVEAVQDGPDLTGDIAISVDRGFVTIDPDRVTFQIGHRDAEALFGKIGPVLKRINTALQQENPS